MAQKDKTCPSCGRIYEPLDWDGPDCPFCEVNLEEVGTNSSLISNLISTKLEWPAGQKRKMITRVGGNMNAQLLKAQLESSGIPVYLESEATVLLGDMQEVHIYVPENMAQEAIAIIGSV
ncbi:MAG: DUF2007 domain-containing protein [Chloroflexi bacterium]|uniref:DUF2007 domain-containing protein n=1 Tax=Candidatus Chlorohelix allophototropha TaxID=3003348 RepID=A0A8T7M296_9CHLR|nr:DUF2007 domain-containing protein [Chloroflexota bacterium]WJW66995.1 DUF2007 domain-containing protein [Chloroflexota bacterium L227-S17]